MVRGSGKFILAAVKRKVEVNDMLLSDLCWNNLGVSGGKILLESLRSNRTLTRLSLTGNNITNDIISAIGRYCLRHMTENEHMRTW